MTLAVVQANGTRQIVISCEFCKARVDDDEIKEGGGLLEMGWHRRFNPTRRRNEYFCPNHH